MGPRSLIFSNARQYFIGTVTTDGPNADHTGHGPHCARARSLSHFRVLGFFRL